MKPNPAAWASVFPSIVAKWENSILYLKMQETTFLTHLVHNGKKFNDLLLCNTPADTTSLFFCLFVSDGTKYSNSMKNCASRLIYYLCHLTSLHFFFYSQNCGRSFTGFSLLHIYCLSPWELEKGEVQKLQKCTELKT